MKYTVHRFPVQVNRDFNHDLGINLSAEELSRDKVQQGPDESLLKAHPPPNNRTVKGKSSLLPAISTFGYQILRYPHLLSFVGLLQNSKKENLFSLEA
ncbi:hypothetical protein ACE6H2_015141 [Prunus campanulata]